MGSSAIQPMGGGVQNLWEFLSAPDQKDRAGLEGQDVVSAHVALGVFWHEATLIPAQGAYSDS